jgi:hypothetical protein
MDDIFKSADQKDKLIESIQQQVLAKENVLSTLANEVKQLQQENEKCDAMCDTNDLIQKIDSSGDSCFLVHDNNVDVHIYLSLVRRLQMMFQILMLKMMMMMIVMMLK